MDRAIKLKRTIHLKVKQPDLRSLRDLAKEMPSWRRDTFTAKYGNLLSLLNDKVQAEALTALGQYFDPLLRCFTFQDYQLAPTLEEFENILCFPPENKNPYRYVEHYPLPENLSNILKVSASELATVVVEIGNVQGLTRKYLEKEALFLAKKEDWATFMDVFALLIYGVVLFPNDKDFIDYTAIDVFLAFKLRGQNPASVILADVYFSLWERHARGSGVMLCCLPVLYRWLTSHIFKRNHHVEVKGKTQWAQYLAGLKGSDISWYSRDQNIDEFVYQCGDFPNVPLIGTKGCITYNPAIALRQLGYPMMNPPLEGSLFAIELEHRGSKDLNMLRRFGRAWDRVVKKGRELGPRATNAGENYLQWVALRVQKIGLPFRLALPVEREIHEPAPIINEEVEELRAALLKSEQGKVELQAQLETLLQEKKNLQQENVIKEKRIVEYREKLTFGNKKLFDVQGCLKGANEELQVRNRDRDRLIDKAYAWETQLNRSLAAGRDLQSQLKEMKSQLERLTAEYESKLVTERRARDVVRERLEECHAALQEELRNAEELKEFAEYQKNLHATLEKDHTDLKVEYLKLDDRCHYFQDRFSKLAKLANDAIISVPSHLKDADIVMTRENTPTEVFEFVEHMKELIVVLKIKAKWPGVLKRKKAWMA